MMDNMMEAMSMRMDQTIANNSHSVIQTLRKEFTFGNESKYSLGQPPKSNDPASKSDDPTSNPTSH